MSHIKDGSNTKMTALFSAAASFVGMMAAVPVSLALFANAQPAQAMQVPQNNDSYAQYAKAYTDGYLSNADGQEVGSCQETQSSKTSKSGAPMATAASHHAHKKSPQAKKHHHKPMTKAQWQKNVSNSYNHYVSVTNNKTEVKTKNINSNNTIASNNTSSSSVTVKDSDGAVVSSNTATNGSNYSHTDVDNVASNNTVVVKDSFNKTDSHDKTVIVKDSGNTTNNTKNTTVIEDSFNYKKEVDVDVNSNNEVKNNDVYVKHEELHL